MNPMQSGAAGSGTAILKAIPPEPHDAAHAPVEALPAVAEPFAVKKRCRIHGRLSTEPRTPAGLARSKLARWKHGLFSAEARQETAHFRQLLRECKEMENVIELDEQLSMPFQVWSTSILAASVTTRLNNSRPNC